MERVDSASKQIRRSPRERGESHAAVLRLLQLNKHLSGAEIARRSGISEPQVSRIVAGLIKDKLVREREDGAESSTRGRPGRRLELESARVAFGAEIQNRKTHCVISNLHGRVIASRSFPTPLSAKKALDKIAEVFVDFRNRLGADRIVGAGVCARGIVDSETGVLVLGGRPDWVNVPIRQILEARLHEPVFLDSNVRAAALAEYNYGSWGVPGSHCLLYVLVEEGVGMGILLEGKVYCGPRMAAGGLGQMVIAASSGCHDRSGRLELLVSNPAICDRYSALTGVQDLPSLEEPTARAREIARLATNGDMIAQQVLEESGRYLGIGIANAVWAIDAEVIVIDGAVTEAWRLIEPPLRSQLASFRGLIVEPSALRGQASIIGAAMLVWSKEFMRSSSARAIHHAPSVESKGT